MCSYRLTQTEIILKKGKMTRDLQYITKLSVSTRIRGIIQFSLCTIIQKIIQNNNYFTKEETANLPGFSVGHIVVVQTSTIDEAPWLGKYTEVGDDTIEVVWMKVDETSRGKEMKYRQGKRLVKWRDRVSKETVILYAIELTKNNRLKAVTVTYLKEQYSKLRSWHHT